MDIRLGKIRIARKRSKRPLFSFSYPEAAIARAIKRIRPWMEPVYGFRRRFATVAVLVLTVWLLVHVMFGANGMLVYHQKREQVSTLKKEIDSLQIENERYDKQIEDLKTNPKTIEKAAREQLHYARPGEVVYVSPPSVFESSAATDSAKK